MLRKLKEHRLFQAAKKYRVWVCLLGALILLAFPLVYRNEYYKSLLVKILIYVILASSLNIINGYSGQFSLGHAGLMCIGAYTTALVSTRHEVNFILLILLSGAVTALAGFLVSLPTLKLKGIYLSIVTLGFSEIVRLVALNWTDFTGGPMGVKGIPAPKLFGVSLHSTNAQYYIVLAAVVITIFSLYRILHSRVGRAWIAIREDQLAASSLGVNLNLYKSLNFVVGAFFAGVGGSLIAYSYRWVSSEMFMTDEAFNIISMVIIGGQGTLVGPVIGAAIVILIPEVFRFAEKFRMVFYAVLIIAMMWWRPQGLAGENNSVLAGAGRRAKRAQAGTGQGR